MKVPTVTTTTPVNVSPALIDSISKEKLLKEIEKKAYELFV